MVFHGGKSTSGFWGGGAFLLDMYCIYLGFNSQLVSLFIVTLVGHTHITQHGSVSNEQMCFGFQFVHRLL